MKSLPDKEKALMRMQTLCSRSEQCSYEITQKLSRLGLSASDIRRVLEQLRDDRFVDDARYARAFVADKYRFAGYGRHKIAMALAAKKISRDMIAEAMEVIDPEEYAARLEHILRAKASRTTDIGTFEGRTKLYRYGLSRGYESSLVAAVVKAIAKGC